jgi:glutathione peroxidase
MSATVPTSPLDFTLDSIDGAPVALDQYRGSVVLIVNVASQCGLTPQYAGLQKLYDTYRERGFVVLGFPANEFGRQEPGTNAEIRAFCSTRFNVTFPMFAKIVVKGEGQHPLYQFLTEPTTDPQFAGEIEWNFAKFLLNRKGEIVARLSARVDPESPEVVAQIEALLAE